MTEKDGSPRIKTRFPPSPTGALHIGGARTALFNWLYARRHGGSFVLRLEDTDLKRSKPEHVESIMEAMEWLGLDYDEGPFYQTKRFRSLPPGGGRACWKKGEAYWCHCHGRKGCRSMPATRPWPRGKSPSTTALCRGKGLGPAPGAVVRLKSPTETATTDYLTTWSRGPYPSANSELDDLIIMRSDGSPTYHLAVVVDDVDMAISHVIRGDDHVNNTPRQVLHLPGHGRAPDTSFRPRAHDPGPGQDQALQAPRGHQRGGIQARPGFLPEVHDSTPSPAWAGPMGTRRCSAVRS